MSESGSIKVYQTSPHPCSYLPEEEARTIYVEPGTKVDDTLHTQLSELGFRRSGRYIYRPNCENCKACVPTRIPVASFQPNRSQRRNWKRNNSLRAIVEVPSFTSQRFNLYSRYIEQRHSEGDMFPANSTQFEDFLVTGTENTRFVDFFLEDELVAMAVIDQLASGISAVYTCFAPELTSKGLGVYMILWQIEHARSNNLPYVYLGYWIKDCDKMNYKIDYQPIELLGTNGWTRTSPSIKSR